MYRYIYDYTEQCSIGVPTSEKTLLYTILSEFRLATYDMSCALCHKQHKSCDILDGVPCSLCKRLGKECVLRKGKRNFKKLREPKRRRVGDASNASGSTGGPPGVPDTRGIMFTDSPSVHHTIIQTLSSLPSSHWGLKCVVKWLFQLAKAKANWWLMTAVSWLATTTGLDGGAFAQGDADVKQLHVSSFNLPSFLVRHHNETAGTGEWNTRIIFATNSEHTQHGCVCWSTRFSELFGNRPGLKENVVKPSVHAPEYLSSQILEESSLHKATSSIFEILKQYVSHSSGPITQNMNATLMTSNGPLKGKTYLTMWLGTHGLDACEIVEFVQGDSGQAVEETNEESEVAASILNLFRQ